MSVTLTFLGGEKEGETIEVRDDTHEIVMQRRKTQFWGQHQRLTYRRYGEYLILDRIEDVGLAPTFRNGNS